MAGMWQILRVAFSTCSRIPPANPSLSAQLPVASPGTTGESGAVHAAGNGALCGGEAQRMAALCNHASGRAPSPAPAGRTLPAAPLSAAPSAAPPPPRPGRSISPGSFCFLPGCAARSELARAEPNPRRLPNVLPDAENERGFPNGSGGEVRVGCLRAPGSARALATHRGRGGVHTPSCYPGSPAGG